MQMRDPLRAARQELGPLGRLFIVSRARTPLYEFLRSTFQEDPSVSVILDRRQGERRPAAAVPGEDRRRSERQAAVDDSLREQGLAIVA
jgi:hypothetical protein